MNVENMRRLIKHLEDPENPIAFNMGTYFEHDGISNKTKDWVVDAVINHPCGTVACLAGHAAIIAWTEDGYTDLNMKVVAEKWLGMDPPDAHYLFYGTWNEKWLGLITKEEAIEHLKSLV